MKIAAILKRSKTVEKIIQAILAKRLGPRFYPREIRKACPEINRNTARTFPSKHRRGKSYGREYFIRHPDGSYSLTTQILDLQES